MDELNKENESKSEKMEKLNLDITVILAANSALKKDYDRVLM